MYHSRREFLSSLALAPLSLRSLGAAGNRLFLIAHRGGIVDAQHPENSPLSVEAAVARGYWMLEVDIRQTRDGQAILQHDATFERFYGDPRRVTELTWEEVQQLRATPGGSRPMSFDELCVRCKGRIHLMLDIKVSDATDAFYESLLATLRRHGMLEATYSLNGDRLPGIAKGAVAEAANRAALEAAITRGEPVSTRRFLFELGSDLDAAAFRLCQQHNVTAVAALNVFRYEKHGDQQLRVVQDDARRLLALGVTHFQIDSVYERFLAP